jgi:hypothetical protein
MSASSGAGCDFANYIELLAPFLACKDLSRLAQTSKDVNKAAAAVEEDVYGANEIAITISKSVIRDTPNPAAMCVHITSEGKRTQMSVPLPFGLSSKAKLRAVLLHKDIWKNYDACVRVHMQEKYHYAHKGRLPLIFMDELLFVTKTYSDNMCKRLEWTRVGFH